jgi:hypothetical protein
MYCSDDPVDRSNLGIYNQHFSQLLGNAMGSPVNQQAPTYYIGLDGAAGQPVQSINHFGQVKQMRKEFKKFSKEEFRDLSKEPVIKDILSGMSKIGLDEAKERIKEHLK